MQKLLKAIDRGLFAAIAVLLMAMVANVAWQVFSRHVLDDPPTWTEEIARYVFTWQIFLGAALAFGRGTHRDPAAHALGFDLGERALRVAAVQSKNTESKMLNL
jgi:hypothetical protein